MQTGFQFRLYPTPAQAQTLRRWIGCQRHIYNTKVMEDRYFRTFARKSLQHAGQHAPIDQRYAHFISEETAWLQEVPSHILRNGAVSWVHAYSRYFKKLAGRPKIQKKTGPQSVWLTSELIRFDPQTDPATGTVSYRFTVGTQKFPVGAIPYKAHRAHGIPASVRIRVEAGRWFLSFTHDEGTELVSAQKIADALSSLTPQELTDRTVGVDRGVAVPFMLSHGTTFDIQPTQKERITQKQKAAIRWQRKLSRRQKGSANRRKAAQRIASLRQYEKCVRTDFAHQTSHQIVGDPRTLLVVFETLGIPRMTKRAKPQQDAHGTWLHNGAKAKSGLNRAILSSAWAKTKACCAYKAQRAGKLVVDVPAHHTSQACSECGYTHPDNRCAQAVFVCQSCGYAANADFNASRNIRNRGVALVLTGQFSEKTKKRTMRMRKKGQILGAGRSEVTPGESEISHGSGNGAVHRTRNQEGCAAMPAEAPSSTGTAG